MGEQRHERGAEAEADDLERHAGHAVGQALRGGGASRRGVEAAEQGVHAEHAEQAQRHDQKARDGSTTQRDVDGILDAALGGSRGTQIGLDGDVHADEASQARAERADEEGDRRADPVRGIIGESADQYPDDQGGHQREQRNGAVLAVQEGHRAFEDQGGDLLHRLRACVLRKDVASEPGGEQDSDNPCQQHDRPEFHRNLCSSYIPDDLRAGGGQIVRDGRRPCGARLFRKTTHGDASHAAR